MNVALCAYESKARNLSSIKVANRPVIVGVGGLTSNVGKTTLMCELLRAFPGWEAIKTTRGHYRSCGKDPAACCVSDLLKGEAVIRSGRESTYLAGKDTGRYWEAGAANVHWLIATDSQVREGIESALPLVRSHGVFIEGNSFTEYVQPDFFIMVARPDVHKIKATAKRAVPRVTAVYFSSETAGANSARDGFLDRYFGDRAVPVFSPPKLPELIKELSWLSVPVALKSTTHLAAGAS
jgi:molybdopterin-guanine dinucleotide biosynthesis protein